MTAARILAVIAAMVSNASASAGVYLPIVGPPPRVLSWSGAS